MHLLTSNKHQTGTDRVAEVASKTDADLYVVIMGDEPLLACEDIEKVIGASADASVDATVLCTAFKDPVDIINVTTQKFALNEDNDLIYMSRSAIPYPQQDLGYPIYKNVGVYAYKRATLDFFQKTPMGRLERAEGSEMLRLIENRKHIKAVITENFSMSVDTPKDLERIRSLIAPDSAELKIERADL
ncbi:MAG: hypothetical protein LBT59_12875 [Clostridiales bacterium]|nr:hypothetical protein [Clostridiales bacterium]